MVDEAPQIGSEDLGAGGASSHGGALSITVAMNNELELEFMGEEMARLSR
jgi:hypothetical protein